LGASGFLVEGHYTVHEIARRKNSFVVFGQVNAAELRPKSRECSSNRGGCNEARNGF
jgi:hypothetical protein